MCCYSALLLTGVVASQPCLGFDTLTRVNGDQVKWCPKREVQILTHHRFQGRSFHYDSVVGIGQLAHW